MIGDRSILDVNVKVRYNSNMTTTTIGEQAVVPPAVGADTLRIGEVAARTGLTTRTIRYYEEVGLLDTPGRTQGDFRLFSENDVARIQDIVRLRELLGFSLAEIRETLAAEQTLVQLRSEYRATEDPQTRIGKLDQAVALTEAQLQLLDKKMAQIAEFNSELKSRLGRYRAKRAALQEVVTAQGTAPGSPEEAPVYE